MEKFGYKFSFGPWNIHEGADPFGPPVRPAVAFDQKLDLLRSLGFDAMQFHDDDAVPELDSLGPAEIRSQAQAMKARLEDRGLVVMAGGNSHEFQNGKDGRVRYSRPLDLGLDFSVTVLGRESGVD